MSNNHNRGQLAGRSAKLVATAMLSLALMLLFVSGVVSAEASNEKAKKTTSLGTALEWIPADAAFYRAAMRNREQVEAVLNSRAWAKLCRLPVCREYARLQSHPLTQAAWQIGKSKLTETQPAVAQMETVLNDPQVQRLIEFLVDISSEEVFVYGDRGFVDIVDLLHEVNLAAVAQSIDGQAGGDRAALETLAKNADRIVVPNLVMGFRIGDRHLAAEQLGKLELILGLACWTQPELGGRMRRERIDGTSYLTFKIDGRLLHNMSNPETDLPLEQLDKEEAQKLRKKLEALKVTIALGIKGDYLLVSIGPSTDGLARLIVSDEVKKPGKQNKNKQAKKPARLIDRVEMRPVRRMLKRRLTSICYRSREFNRAICSQQRYTSALAERIDACLASSELDDATKARLRRDAAALRKDVESLRRRPGSLVSVCMMNRRGMESYCFDRSEHPWLKGYKPLGLLEHVGGRPLLLGSYRTTCTVKEYEAATRRLSSAYDYFEDRVLWNIDAKWRKRCRLTVALLRPILRQIDRVNRRVLIPALQDGQVVFVCNDDGPALVLDTGVAERLREVYREYWTVYRDVVDALEDTRSGERPDFSAAEPSVSPCPLPDWMQPCDEAAIGRSGRVVILATSPAAVRRLLAPTPPSLGNLPAKAKHPRATVAFIDTAALLERAEPGIKRAARRVAGWTSKDENRAEIEKQVDLHVETLLDCMQVLRSVASERYVKNGAVVTHRMWEIRDVD